MKTELTLNNHHFVLDTAYNSVYIEANGIYLFVGNLIRGYNSLRSIAESYFDAEEEDDESEHEFL